MGRTTWPAGIAAAAYANDREVRRRLKIGYVSPDFREHSVAYFRGAAAEGTRSTSGGSVLLCRGEAAGHSYGASAEACRSLAGDSWAVGREIAQRIRADGIDILVDLAGHTAKNRLRVFARKPAPIQVTWLGYPNTTGLEAIDYRLVDAVTDPVGEADAWASETLVRLEGGFLCYGPIE